MKRYLLPFAVTSVALLMACSGDEANSTDSTDAAGTTAADVTREAQEAAKAAGDYTREKAEQLQQEMQTKLDDVNAQISKLKEQAQGLSESAKQEWDKRIEQLEAQSAKMKEKLTSLKDATGEAWAEVSQGCTGGLVRTVNVHQACDRASARA
jgi:peptidoglycan hydrolase CwlO-like protein